MLTILRMISVPIDLQRAARRRSSGCRADRVSSVFMCSGDTTHEHQRQRRRQRRQHPAGDAAVRGDDAHLALDLEALADDRARLSSTSDRLPPVSRCVSTAVDEEPRVEQRHPLGERLAAPRAAACRSSAGRRAAGTRRRPASGISSATIDRPVVNAWPARSARASGRSPPGTAPRTCRSRRFALAADEHEREVRAEQRRGGERQPA